MITKIRIYQQGAQTHVDKIWQVSRRSYLIISFKDQNPNPKRPRLTPPPMSVDLLATAVRSLDADACNGGLLERHGPARHAGAVLNAELLVREFLYMSWDVVRPSEVVAAPFVC
ncbi:hypothetical protein BDV09DRAFT_39678 [Aspergillus tetrazonus]